MFLFLHGRFCAIVCTCAFFYFIPRLRATVGQLDATEKDRLVSDRLDFSSREHKKKVVLEGLLVRSHRSL
uniref:Uncharacterized protein n=1 Tax=Rhizophora mucronata TaxID=61149 RepID=A0A2P2JVH4_RHIMU